MSSNNNDKINEVKKLRNSLPDNNSPPVGKEEEQPKEVDAAGALWKLSASKRSAVELGPDDYAPWFGPKRLELIPNIGSSNISSAQNIQDRKGKGKEIAIDEKREKEKAKDKEIFRTFFEKPKGLSIGKSPDESSAAKKKDDLDFNIGAIVPTENTKVQCQGTLELEPGELGKGTLKLEADDFVADDQTCYVNSDGSLSWFSSSSSDEDSDEDYNTSGEWEPWHADQHDKVTSAVAHVVEWEPWPADIVEKFSKATSGVADVVNPHPPPPSSSEPQSIGTSMDKVDDTSTDDGAAKKDDNGVDKKDDEDAEDTQSKISGLFSCKKD